MIIQNFNFWFLEWFELLIDDSLNIWFMQDFFTQFSEIVLLAISFGWFLNLM